MSNELALTAGLARARRSKAILFGASALVVVALWLLARPYDGLRHDGVLYFGQALLQLEHGEMSKDVFFAFGSQDRFSLFSRALAPLYAWIGIGPTNLLLLVICQAALFSGVWRLLAPLPDNEQKWLALVAIAVCSHIYGGIRIFAFGEGFVTGRTLAEPLAVFAVVMLMRRRRAAALACWVSSALLHPLVALPVLAVGWCLLCLQDKAWLRAAWLLLLPLVLAISGVAPFDSLLLHFDTAWWALVEANNRHVLLLQWDLGDWQVVVFDLLVLATACRTLPAMAELAKATLLASVLLIAMSLLGADLLRNVLITQLQLWRVMWFAHMLALALLPAICLALWRRRPVGGLAALALATAGVAAYGFWDAGWALLIWAAAALTLMSSEQPLSPALRRAAFGATWMALAGITISLALRTADALAADSPEASRWVQIAATSPALMFPAAWWLLTATRRGAGFLLIATAVSLIAVAYGAATWDRRSPWIRSLESRLERPHPFTVLIPPGAQVYWHKDLLATWALLRRPSYYSVQQSSGLLFSRETALEYGRRERAFAPLHLQAQICGLMAGLNDVKSDEHDCTPTQEVVDELCQMHDGPDFLIFERNLKRGVVARWTFSESEMKARTYYLYDCSSIR